MMKKNWFQRKALGSYYFGKPSWKKYICKNPKGIQQPTRFGLGLSYFREHKVKCKFQDTLDQIYNSNGDTEISCY